MNPILAESGIKASCPCHIVLFLAFVAFVWALVVWIVSLIKSSSGK